MTTRRRWLQTFVGDAWSLAACSALLALGCAVTPARADVGSAAVGTPAGKPCPHSGGSDQVAWWARESYGSRYAGQYVGGGSPYSKGRGVFRSEPRCADEGTFGMDYDPGWSRVGLFWSHGRRYQSGHGQYETEKKNRGFPNLFGK